MEINIKVNGKEYKLDVNPLERLIYTIRERLGLTGTKLGCGEGECGACSILLNGKVVNSCLILSSQIDGAEIITIEGANLIEKMQKIQKAFVEHGAIQCGFCTPGFVISSTALLLENPNPTKKEIMEGISGNICRCTGYIKIIEAIESVTKNP